MPNTKELQNRIGSIRDTMKITNAMYMISSMKLRKAKTKLENTEPYFLGLQTEISNILLHFPDMEDRYFDNNEEEDPAREKKRGYIIVVGDKGLAGAYNHNVIQEALQHIEPEDHLFVVGEVGRHELAAAGYDVDSDFLFSATNPSMHRARVIAENIVELYKNKELDEVYMIYTHMVNTMKSEVRMERLLPLKTHTFLKEELVEKAMSEQGGKTREQIEMEAAEDWYLIYPTPVKVLEKLVYNYITGYVYGVLVEGSASEENARMMAMQAATDNAKEILGELSIQFNRARQSAITQEITEVIAGAKALKKKKKRRTK